MTPAPEAAAPELDELTITIVVDNVTDTLSGIAPGVPQLPEMAYLLGGIPPSGRHDGHDCVVGFDHLCVACHGFSALATARQGDRSSTVLFDVGSYADVWLANAERLSIDLSSIDVLFLSHWHWDHSGGIPTVVAAIAKARSDAGRPPITVDVHPDRPDQRGILTPFGIFAMLPPEPHHRSHRSCRCSRRPSRRRALGWRSLPRQRRHLASDGLRNRTGRTPQLAWRPGDPGCGDP